MASLSTTMTAAVERGMRLASVEFACDVIRQLKEEGLEWLFSARARVLEADGTALRARTLWVAPMGFGERLP